MHTLKIQSRSNWEKGIQEVIEHKGPLPHHVGRVLRGTKKVKKEGEKRGEGAKEEWRHSHATKFKCPPVHVYLFSKEYY
jgi:hypothetical protein